MASYHFHLAHVSRGAGQSAVAAAAYRAGEYLRDDYYGEVHDFTKKGGVIKSEIILPNNAPERFSKRELLWNEVEEIEKNKRAQLAYSFDFTLQNELSMEENIAVAEKFIRENFTSRGMICDVAVHSPGRGPDDNPNPHVHVLVPMRPLNDDGTWGTKQRREYILDENGNRIRGEDGKYLFNAVKTNDWGDPETLILWRENWAKAVNEAFAKNGITERVDARSYVDQGIDKLPQVHEGPAVRAMEKKGIRTDKGDWNRFVKGLNKTITFILGVFKSIIDDIDETKKQKAADAAYKKEFFDAIEDYKKTIEAKYYDGKNKLKSKKMIELYTFILNNHITDIDSFRDYSKLMWDKVSETRQAARKVEDRISEIDSILRHYDQYKENRAVYKKWYEMPAGKKKNEFAEKYDGRLRIYHMAERELKKLFPDMKVPVKSLMKEREELREKARGLSYQLEHDKRAANQAYAFKKQIYEPHVKKKTVERS